MTLLGLGKLRLGLNLVALGCVLSSAQKLVKQDDGSGVVRVLFQNNAWAASNLHFSADGHAWTGTHGVPMQRSLLEGEFSAANGWFQHEVPASQLKFVFNNGGDLWHHNGASRALFEVTKPGTYAVHAGEQERALRAAGGVSTDGYVTTAGYSVTKVREKSADRVVLELGVNADNKDTSYGENVKELLVEATKTAQNVLRVEISDKNAKRWEVPAKLYVKGDLSKTNSAGAGQQQQQQQWGARSTLEFSFTENPFSFQVTRKSDGFVLFDTSKLSLVFKDQYLQVSTAIAGGTSLFGLGESTRDTLQIQPGDKHTLWARDQFSNERVNNLYGAHPFYLGLNDKGAAHGVLLLNSNGMDVTLDTDKLVYQTLGGVLDFHIVSGPTPADVVAQYTTLVGKPKLQPYWSYGFHQCRWGYTSVSALREVVDKYAAAKIPLDIIWSDIDHMNKYYDFTLDPTNFTLPEVQKFIGDVHAKGQKFVPIIDPGIADDRTYDAYTRGLELDVFIKDTAGKPYLGQVWPGPTVFPDFFHPKAASYWEEQLAAFHKKVDFDGIWLDMNELANFCPGNTCARKANATCPLTGSISNIVTCCLECVDDMNKWDHPPFAIHNVQVQEPLFKKGISTSALQYGGIRQYDSHNLYGFTESIATAAAQEKVLGKRAFTLSRSTFPGSGAYVAHWTGDNGATWDDIRWSVVTIQNFGLFGIPMVGSDICGFLGATTEELCARWTALGAFYPFARNHNNFGEPSQETYVWESVAAIGRKFIGARYRLLPYFYTLGYQATVTGAPIARSLFFEFPTDKNARASPALDRQFLIGSALLVTPVLTQGATSVTGYVPAGTWYNLFDFSKVESKGEEITWPVKLDDMPVLVRGGSILPLHQGGELTSAAARKTPFDILVALPSSSSGAAAAGQLYLDDGEDLQGASKSSIVEFKATATSFSSQVGVNKYADAKNSKVNKVVVLGVTAEPKGVVVNGSPKLGGAFTYTAATQQLEINLSKLDLSIVDPISIVWN